MSKKQKQMILLGLLAVVALVAVYFKIIKKDPEMEEYLANVEARKAQEAQGPQTGAQQEASGGAPAAKPAQPAGAPGLAEEITLAELEQLMGEIQPVEFNYDEAYLETSLTRRNPMSPLVSDTGVQIWQPGSETAYAEGGEEGEEAAPAPNQQTFDRMMQAQAMAISGIVWSSDNPAAVIDDEIVSVGSQLGDDIYVESIEQDRVLLRVGDQTVPLELKEP